MRAQGLADTALDAIDDLPAVKGRTLTSQPGGISHGGADIASQAMAGPHAVTMTNEVRVPTQFDDFKMRDNGNQCAFCAHEFALRAGELLAASAESGEALLTVYTACMRRGTARRQCCCDSGAALPVGENIDDPAVLCSAQASLADGQGADPHLGPFRIVRAAPGSIFHAQRPAVPLMFPDPALASRIIAASDECRHPAATRADFETALRGLPQGGVMVLERHMEAMALLRADDSQFLVCDSHSPRCGLVSIEGALEYVLGLIPDSDFPLIFAATESV